MLKILLTILCLSITTTAFAVVVPVPEYPLYLYPDPVDGVTINGATYVFPSTVPVSREYVLSRNFSNATEFYNNYWAQPQVTSQDGNLYLSQFTASVPSSYPAFLDIYKVTHLITSVAYPADSSPMSLEAFLSYSQEIGLGVPPDSVKVLLSSIDDKLTKIVGNSDNDQFVPVSLRGLITTKDYFFLMGCTGLLSAGLVGLYWSRGI